MTHTRPYRTELTPTSFLRRAAYVFPNNPAVVHGARRYTWHEVAERVNRFANRLRDLGLQKHDRVAILCPNTPAIQEAHFAVPLAGGIIVAINTRLSTPEIDYILQHSGATFLLADAELLPLIEPLDLTNLHLVRVDDTGQPDDPYEAFLAAGSPEEPESWLEDEEETIAIGYTSGTTGDPKGVMTTHRGAYLNALGNALENRFGQDSVYLWVLPMFHCNGWCYPWAVTAAAGVHVCLRRVEPARIWALLETERVTHYCCAPTVQIALVNHPDSHPLPQRVTANLGGAPPSPTLIAQSEALNLVPVHLYGLTETYGPTTICEFHDEWADLPSAEVARLRARQGQCHITANLVRVVDDDGRDVPRDGTTQGEVVMRGNTVMRGYYRNETATADAFRHGAFHSGDIAVWHPDGNIELRDRKKDIIISGGENISTIEVEQAVASHPAVLECAVVAMPDERWGERPKAYVTLKPGQSATAQELIAHCRDRLAHFKSPAAVEFGDLPKTSTGKVQKYLLREREWSGREKRIN